jgi:aspartyl-tRNA(Asn)/glutamyl-tRNA(Gln) amidotransferase subunit A
LCPNNENYKRTGIKDLKIGVPKEYFIEGIDPEVKDALDKALKIFEKLGAKIEEASLPHTEYSLPTYYLIATAEASSNLARYDGVQYGYRAEDYDDLSCLLLESPESSYFNKRRF